MIVEASHVSTKGTEQALYRPSPLVGKPLAVAKVSLSLNGVPCLDPDAQSALALSKCSGCQMLTLVSAPNLVRKTPKPEEEMLSSEEIQNRHVGSFPGVHISLYHLDS